MHKSVRPKAVIELEVEWMGNGELPAQRRGANLLVDVYKMRKLPYA